MGDSNAPKWLLTTGAGVDDERIFALVRLRAANIVACALVGVGALCFGRRGKGRGQPKANFRPTTNMEGPVVFMPFRAAVSP